MSLQEAKAKWRAKNEQMQKAIPVEIKEDASLSFGCREQAMEVVDSLLRGGL